MASDDRTQGISNLWENHHCEVMTALGVEIAKLVMQWVRIQEGPNQAEARALLGQLLTTRIVTLATLMSGVDVENDRRQAESKRRKRGGAVSSEVRRRKRDSDTAWMRPIFDAAYAALEAECPARIGADKLASAAWRSVGKDHPEHRRRSGLTTYRARGYLKNRARSGH